MNISGPTPLVPIQRADETGLALRLNQRIAAEVLQVSGDRVTLAMEGVHVVAQLTSSDQPAALLERRTAQFVVRDTSGPLMVLQLVNSGQPSPVSKATPDLIPNLLRFAGLEVSDAATYIARALLSHGLPVTADLVTELQEALAQVEGWSQADAETAAALKSEGLLLSAGTLTLARSPSPPLAEMLASLYTRLQTLSKRRLPPELAALVQNALTALEGMAVDWSDPAALSDALKRAASGVGRSLESELVHLARSKDTPQAAGGSQAALTLATLRRSLSGGEFQPLADDIEHFLDAMRVMQFANSGPDSPPVKERWLSLDLPLGALAAQEGDPSGGKAHIQPAHIRIAYPPDGESNAIDPAHTRLVIRVDLDARTTLQVDLSVADHRIGAHILASDDDLRLAAEGEMPGLQAGLEKLGFILQTARCEAGLPAVNDAQSPSAWTVFSEVRAEV